MIDDLEKLKKLDYLFWKHAEPVIDCWLWDGWVNPINDYGEVTRNHKEKERTHRYAFRSSHGYIDDHLNVNHTCDVRVCIRPSHLWQGTQLENMRDMFDKGRGYNLAELFKGKLGEDAPRVKLKTAQVLEIKEMLADKTPKTHIAKTFSISPSTVYDISIGKTWTHI